MSTSTRTPLQDLPEVKCQDCAWERRAQLQNLDELRILGRQHITETEGHQVFLFDPRKAAR